jgi:hypothetical protein
MKYTNVGVIMRNIERDNQIIFDMQCDRAKMMFKHINDLITTEDLQVACDVAEEYTGVCFNLLQMNLLLDVFPVVKVGVMLNRSDNSLDTDTRECLCSAVSGYFVGCDWPTYGDSLTNEQHDKFVAKIHEQAIKLGFKITK